ncbi:C4-dicarboxylate TRAP transporter substrate-binding protein [Ponticoccus sp. SC2-23]|uniref:C4-dicarboxylate TRAP transporter substrate-binding protein n=1 Tax=Alexandriicola marinus TaxID=2081710 RepID=UPI000FDA4283|nr:C4-dicarboxylate TRAP transporter substrate-binding protein [Alexandriicola marinus]MBM1220888.1 C4-dicarboxylate TRAP transporter substrate-binding protein [Ponticoccus sp. SC6-9]MBM1225458.1 C4-dicarboxylate TRAP transporter substrate-binding protein [Ponticoccus sp. SC6-15]MBM1227641.1 C4-dicarboxylate TRAP transporter substrate-binding protein [Ponticoccus sp. SC6-38]MBM1234721.1 C4-dicarboxylate TRAP transporter substrate-binding protein [Ponticoccus sp. SC6-45]MBM1238143.1 C4-dicarbox
MTLRTTTFAAALAALPAATMADSFSATVAAGHPPVFRWVQMVDQAFVPAVAENLEGTGHSVTFQGLYGGAIAGVGEELEAVEAGLAEIGICQSLFDPAKLAVHNVTYYTPFVSDDARTISDLMDELLSTDARMQQPFEDNGVVYLGAPVAIDDYLLMTNFPVESLADLEGRKIGAPGAALNWLSGTGAVGVSGNLTTYYNELSSGVFDGVIVFASAALPGKLYEVAPYITRMGLGAQYAGSLCANADWWAGLPTEVQDAMLAAADTTSDWYLDALEGAVEAAFAAMGEQGATITEAPAEMREAWAAGMDNAAKAWAEELDANGQPGSEILSLYMETMRAGGATPLRDWDME